MKTHDTEKPDECWELAKEGLAAYRQKKTAGPGGEQNTYLENDGLRLQALKKTLQQFEICPRLYSLMDKDEDDTICLNYLDGAWATYSMDRCERYLGHSHQSFDLAALEFLGCLAKNQEGEANCASLFSNCPLRCWSLRFKRKYEASKVLGRANAAQGVFYPGGLQQSTAMPF